jgi:hypothetical protein
MTGSVQGPLRRIDASSGEAVVLEGSGEATVLNGSGSLRPTWAAYTSDGRRVVGVFPYGSTQLWDVGTGEQIAQQKSRGSENFGAVAVSPDTGAVLVADADGSVVELDGGTLSPTGRSIDVGAVPLRISGSVDGTFAVTAFGTGDETDIVFGDLDSGRLTRAHIDGFVTQTSFNADGTRYAFGTDRGDIGIIDVVTGSRSGPSTAVHGRHVTWVTFSPDGETLATMGGDGELVLSDGDSARPRARSNPRSIHLDGAMSYRADGATILIGYPDEAVVEFDVDPGAWIEHACRVAGRDLSSAEWSDTFGSGRRPHTCGGP